MPLLLVSISGSNPFAFEANSFQHVSPLVGRQMAWRSLSGQCHIVFPETEFCTNRGAGNRACRPAFSRPGRLKGVGALGTARIGAPRFLQQSQLWENYAALASQAAVPALKPALCVDRPSATKLQATFSHKPNLSAIADSRLVAARLRADTEPPPKGVPMALRATKGDEAQWGVLQPCFSLRRALARPASAARPSRLGCFSTASLTDTHRNTARRRFTRSCRIP
jgi:hypothetical protein